MLSRLSRWAHTCAAPPPWTNVYGLARTLLAAGTALTLATNAPETLFRPALGAEVFPRCSGIAASSVFCIGREHLKLVQAASVVVLAVVASGWRPRVTAIPHFWISASLLSATIPDGGDHVTQVLTLLLLPIALTDARIWHWGPPPASYRESAALVAASALAAVKVQVAVIYLHAAVGKLMVPEWVDGTALYYWLSDPAFGAPRSIREFVMPIVESGAGVTALTWGSIALEACLGVALLLGVRSRGVLLLLGIAFHWGIALVMGLVSFSLAMTAALILYLRPAHQPVRVGAAMRWERLGPLPGTSAPVIGVARERQ